MTFDFSALRDMRDPEAMTRHLEGIRAQAEQRREQLQQQKSQLEAITVTCTDPQGMATVTLGHDGELRELAIDPRLTPPQYRYLGQAVITALAEGRRELKERMDGTPRTA